MPPKNKKTLPPEKTEKPHVPEPEKPNVPNDPRITLYRGIIARLRGMLEQAAAQLEGNMRHDSLRRQILETLKEIDEPQQAQEAPSSTENAENSNAGDK